MTGIALALAFCAGAVVGVVLMAALQIVRDQAEDAE